MFGERENTDTDRGKEKWRKNEGSDTEASGQGVKIQMWRVTIWVARGLGGRMDRMTLGRTGLNGRGGRVPTSWPIWF